jgi:hypothetical protein
MLQWLKSKFFWLNVIAIALLVLQYAANNSMVPASWVKYESLAVVVLNAIAGMIQANAIRKLKRLVKALQYEARIK